VRFERYDGAGNRFLLVADLPSGSGAAELARLACARPSFDGSRADGLLFLSRDEDGARRLVVHNADGGRPEACGNGLRCAAWHLLREGAETRVLLRMDVGERRARLLARDGARAELRASMGRADVSELTLGLPPVPGLQRAHRVSVGNPHCVLRVGDERLVDVDGLGRELQAHPDYPDGVNVGFLARRGGAWRLRVFERGVGETEACGTGACAAVATLREEGAIAEREVSVQMAGGCLRVLPAADGELELAGTATRHAPCELELGQGVR